MPGGPTILVVDDYADSLDVWALFLGAAGFKVLTAVDGQAALSCAGETVPDLIVMDIELPGISGLEVARRLKQETSTQHIPLIAMTGRGRAAEVEEAHRSGFQEVLIKPCDPDAVVQQIRRLLDAPRLQSSD
jgi:CheY-like chemotaxis protein